MRSLIVTVLSTLDGYAAGEGGNVFVMPIDLGFDHYNLDRMRAADTMLFGATSFHGARSYWPPPRRRRGRPGGRAKDLASPQHPRQVVVSDSTDPADTSPWGANTEIVSRAEAPARIAELKRGDGRDIVGFGSVTTWNDLLARGLVDEVHLLLGPGAIGSGVPTFGRPVEQQLTLLDVQRPGGLEAGRPAVRRRRWRPRPMTRRHSSTTNSTGADGR